MGILLVQLQSGKCAAGVFTKINEQYLKWIGSIGLIEFLYNQILTDEKNFIIGGV